MGSFALMSDLATELSPSHWWCRRTAPICFPSLAPYSDAGMNRLLDAAASVVVPSRTFLESVLESYPIVAKKASCIYNGYDEREFEEPAPPRMTAAVRLASCASRS